MYPVNTIVWPQYISPLRNKTENGEFVLLVFANVLNWIGSLIWFDPSHDDSPVAVIIYVVNWVQFAGKYRRTGELCAFWMSADHQCLCGQCCPGGLVDSPRVTSVVTRPLVYAVTSVQRSVSVSAGSPVATGVYVVTSDHINTSGDWTTVTSGALTMTKYIIAHPVPYG